MGLIRKAFQIHSFETFPAQVFPMEDQGILSKRILSIEFRRVRYLGKAKLRL